MVIQLDLLHRDYLQAFPQVVNTFNRYCAQSGRLADLLETIIIEETGRVLPIAYGFNPDFAIGNVKDFTADVFNRYETEIIPLLKTLYNDTLEKVLANTAQDMVNWNELLVNESMGIHQ